jgi:CubicO group peptidase (beta-lactamase class C family)
VRDSEDLSRIVSASLNEHLAPSAMVAVGGRDGIERSAGGRQPDFDPAALFEVGSVTKVLTTTLVLQQVARGRLDLDDPVIRHLPGFTLADEAAASQISVRHLLTHTSGIDAADDFTDTGEDDDCVRRYVEEVISQAGLVHPVGDRWSYCNGAFVVLGHLVEVLTGKCWDDALTEGVLAPCGMSGATRYRVRDGQAVLTGHRTDPSSGTVLPHPVQLPRSTGPVGGTLVVTAEDLVRFGQHFFSGALVPPSLVTEAMTRVPQVTGPGQGLGWKVPRTDPAVALHAGATFAFTAFVAVWPGTQEVLAVTANGGGAPLIGGAVARARHGRTLRDDEPPATVDEAYLSPEQCAGTFRRKGVALRFTVDQGRLMLSSQFEAPLDAYYPPLEPVVLEPLGGHRFESRRPFDTEPGLWIFSDLDRQGRPGRVYSRRVAVRVE